MKCNEFRNGSGSDPFHIGNEFGGIPAGLATNLVAWLCIMAVFLILSSREMTRSVKYGVLTWLRQLHIVQSITFTDDEMRERAGTDAVQYLRYGFFLYKFPHSTRKRFKVYFVQVSKVPCVSLRSSNHLWSDHAPNQHDRQRL